MIDGHIPIERGAYTLDKNADSVVNVASKANMS